MSLKTAVAAALKAVRQAHGLTQKDLAEVSSRTYISKLERGKSSPTLEMLTTLSVPLELSPLTLVALTIGADTGQSISSLCHQVENEIAELAQAGVLAELQTPPDHAVLPSTQRPAAKVKAPARPTHQTEFSFAD